MVSQTIGFSDLYMF